MGRRAHACRRDTERSIRRDPLSADERARLRKLAKYEGSPYHKRNPGDFGLTPPAAPRRDATLCDEAGVLSLEAASSLFERAILAGLASEATTHGFPKHLWVVDESGQVFEASYGGSRTGAYHGYPIRRSNPLHEEVRAVWERR